MKMKQVWCKRSDLAYVFRVNKKTSHFIITLLEKKTINENTRHFFSTITRMKSDREIHRVELLEAKW